MVRSLKIPLLRFVAIFFGFVTLRTAAATFYVDANGTNPELPYANWSTAATNIQNALSLTASNDLVLVTNGIYQYGSTLFNDPTNQVTQHVPCRILVPSGVTVSSVNGPSVTIILGNQICCACLAGNSVLSGFTLTNGTSALGGGAFCPTTNTLISNCIICSNRAEAGGGVYLGTLNHCILSNNIATIVGTTTGPLSGGGACGSILNNCILIGNTAAWGGGAYNCNLNSFSLIENTASNTPSSNAGGGGAFGGTLNNCLVMSNSVLTGLYFGFGDGGGCCSNVVNNSVLIYNTSGPDATSTAWACSLTNCTICYNYVPRGSDLDNMLAYCALRNCILYYNTNAGSNGQQYGTTNFQSCCLQPIEDGKFGSNNTTNPPLFTGALDFHLQTNSPCINSGNNSYVTTTTDLDGNSRIVGGTVDMGAYEYQTPASVISYAYLQQYGLPTDGSVDFADLDGTGFNVFQDWIAGLNPTNSSSILVMLSSVATNNASGITVTWQSVTNILYNLQRSTNLTTSFLTIQSNIVGQAGTTSYRDASATNNTPYFYRVGVP